MIKTILLLMLAAASAMAEGPGAQRKLFWRTYKKAFLQKELRTLQWYVRFPVEVKGVDDGDAKFFVGKEKFAKCFEFIFTSDTGLSAKEQSHLEYIKDLDKLPDSLRAGNLVFENKNEKFELVRFYLNTADEKVKSACQ